MKLSKLGLTFSRKGDMYIWLCRSLVMSSQLQRRGNAGCESLNNNRLLINNRLPLLQTILFNECPLYEQYAIEQNVHGFSTKM